MDPGEEKALEDIDKYGCHILHVFEGEGNPRFTYSIGIEKTTGRPELIVTGLKRELAQSIINEYNRRVRSGETFQVDEYYDGFLGGFQVTLKRMEKKHYREYLGWALWLYQGLDFDVLQLIYPTVEGLWPWDDDAPDDFLWFLPRLYAIE